MRLVDSHCHLNFKAFAGDYLDVAKRAKEAGIEKIIIPGSNIENSMSAIAMAEKINNVIAPCLPAGRIPPEREKQSEPLSSRACPAPLSRAQSRDLTSDLYAYPAIGIHPVHVDELDRFSEIEKLSGEAIAIGECGLDFYHDKDKKTLEAQKELFIKHIDLALVHGLPLICHNREADEEMLEILESRAKLPKLVFHCFSSNWKFAEFILEKGAYLSFTGNITYGNKSLKKVIERAPLDRLMIETDAPYIVPEPLRLGGTKRNEPAYVVEVAKKIALIKGLTLDEVVSATTENAQDFF